MRFCYIFLCTKKEKILFDINEYFLFCKRKKDIFTYSIYLRGYFLFFFFFYFTKIVIIIYIFFFLSNFPPSKMNEWMRDTRCFYFFLLRESTVYAQFFLFFFFFRNRATRCSTQRFTTIPILSKRKTNFIGRCIGNPGKNFSHCLKPRHVCAEEREREREFVNSDITSSHVFIRETFRFDSRPKLFFRL